MTESHSDDFIISYASGDIVLEDADGDRVEGGVSADGLQLRIPIDDVEGLVEVSKRFEEMQERIWDIPVAIGPRIEGDERMRSNHTLRFAAGPFFEHLSELRLYGEFLPIEGDWTDLVFWGRGGITFRTPDMGHAIAVGITRSDLETHLEKIAAPGVAR